MNNHIFAAGQKIVAGFDGVSLNAELKFLIKNIKVGGIILFSRNIESPEQIMDLTSSAQAFAGECGLPPLFIAIDQEGGKVARLKPPFTVFDGAPYIKTKNDAKKFADITAKELLSVGINMNMAPVLDVASKNMKSIMEQRSFGHDPSHVADMGKIIIENFQKMGLIAVCKHFPGIGRTITDSHIDLPYMEKDFSDLESFDLPPFISAIKNGVAGVMLSHILYAKIDKKWPASLSEIIAKKLLRENQALGFKGISITDDLDMGAIKKYFDMKTIAQRILKAHMDIALICHNIPDTEYIFSYFSDRSKNDPEAEKIIKNSAKRIIGIKQKYLGI